MRFTILSFLFAITFSTFAGDYELFIIEKNSVTCSEKSLPEIRQCFGANIYRPVYTTEELDTDLNKYFSGEKNDIGILVPAFGNGHLVFCSLESKHKIKESLRRIRESGVNERGGRLDDFVNVNKL